MRFFHFERNAFLWSTRVLDSVLNSGTALCMSASSSPARQLLILLLFLLASVLHQMMSPCENFLFYFRSIGRLLDWVESLPRHKGSDLSESPNGGRENILIESSTVLNSEKDFSKFDQIDRESHHLLGGLTDRPSWAERPCHRTFL